jgi:hypothetical protein
MVTRLLLSLRKASDPKTIARWDMDHFTGHRTFTTVTTTVGHSASSGTGNFATMHVSQFEILDSALELSGLGSQYEEHRMVRYNVLREVPAV